MKRSQERAMFANLKKKGIKAYDVVEGKKVTMKNPELVRMRNGVYAAEGKSPINGRKVFRIIGRKFPKAD